MRKNVYRLLSAVVTVIFLASCSSNAKVEHLMSLVPASSDVVVIGNTKVIVESAGGSIEENNIKLPSFITDVISKKDMEDFDEFNYHLKNSGIDVEAVAMVCNEKNYYHPFLIVSLYDKEKFVNKIDEKFREKVSVSEENFAVYVREGEYTSDYIFVVGDDAYIVADVWNDDDYESLDPVRLVKRMIEEAEEKSIDKTTFGNYIMEGNAAGVIAKIPLEFKEEMKRMGVPTEMLAACNGVMCFRGNLSDNECLVEAKMFNENGEEYTTEYFEKYFDKTAKINKEVLSYLGEDENFVYAASLKNFKWDNYFDAIGGMRELSRMDRNRLTALKSYFKNIDGTMAMGLGVKGGLGSLGKLSQGRDIENASFTFVMEVKDGKKMIDDMKKLMTELKIPFIDSSSSGFYIDFPMEHSSFPLFAEAKDNVIVLSNRKINPNNTNPVVNTYDFGSYFCAFGVVFNKGNQMFQDLGIDNDIKLLFAGNPEENKAHISLMVDGGKDKGVAAKVIRMFVNIYDNRRGIEQKLEFSEDYSGYDEEYYDYADTLAPYEDDYVAADSVVADSAAVW